MSEHEYEGEFIPNKPPGDEIDSDEDLSAEGLLRYSQGVRKNLVKSMTTRGLPEDKADRQVLLQALHDMDQTSVNRLKLDVDRENTASGKAVQELVERLAQINPRGLSVTPGEEVDRIPTPALGEIPETNVGDGETDIGVRQETSKEFLERMESK
jgi:hypothetical protein